jgi:hypothetical protein
MNSVITSASLHLYNSYPEVQTYYDSYQADPTFTCDPYDGFAKYDNLIEAPGGGFSVSSAVGCQWGPYVAHLAACAKTGPIVYWACAYVAYCAWCEDSQGICSLGDGGGRDPVDDPVEDPSDP